MASYSPRSEDLRNKRQSVVLAVRSEPRSFPPGFYARDAEDAAAVMATLGFDKSTRVGFGLFGHLFGG